MTGLSQVINPLVSTNFGCFSFLIGVCSKEKCWTCVGKGGKTSLTGVEIGIGISAAEKTWRMLRAIGDIAFAYGFSQVLVEIQVMFC